MCVLSIDSLNGLLECLISIYLWNSLITVQLQLENLILAFSIIFLQDFVRIHKDLGNNLLLRGGWE